LCLIFFGEKETSVAPMVEQELLEADIEEEEEN
jgi:hypothetical protein